MKINDIIKAKIIDNGINGEGIAKLENFTIFIPFALKDEEVEICITKLKDNLAFGKLVNIIIPSKERISPKCSVFGLCGGCDLQHTNYQNQLKIKTAIVKTTLRKSLGKDYAVNDCIASPKNFCYRNKIEVPINDNLIGFYQKNTNSVVPTNQCLLCEGWGVKLLQIVEDYIKKYEISTYNKKTKSGNLRHLVARYLDENLMLVLVCNEKQIAHQNELVTALKNEFPKLSVFQNINTKTDGEIMSNDFKLLYGQPVQNTKEFGVMFEVSPYSFLQVNRDMQNIIFKNILDNIDSNSIVIDAFSGAGLLSAIISKKCKKVYGIEIVKDATKNANELVRQNKIENIENINGDCSIEIPKLLDKIKPQITQNLNVILDPPRKGVSKNVLESIINAKPNKIIYLSCNPATLARDLKELVANYEIETIQLYDMFPQTKHIETLVILNRKNVKIFDFLTIY